MQDSCWSLDLPWPPLNEDRINGEKDNIIPRLAGSKKENFTLRGKKEDQGKLRCTILKSKKGKI
jgi:hypothetical protein